MHYTIRIAQQGLLILLIAVLSACTQSEEMYRVSVEKMAAIAKVSALQNEKLVKNQPTELPSSVSNMLAKPTSLHKKEAEKRFNIAVNNMTAKNFFTYLSGQTGENIIVSPEAVSLITLHLKQVTLPDVFLAVEDTYGFSITHFGYGYRVNPATLITRSYHVSQLAINRTGTSSMSINDMGGSSSSGSSSTSTSSTSSSSSSGSSSVESKFGETNFWIELEAALTQLVGAEKGNEKSVTVSRSTGLIVVKGMPKDQKAVAEFIHEINTINAKQVVIDAIVLEVTRSHTEKAGIESLSLPKFSWSPTGGELQYGTSIGTSSLASVVSMLSKVGKVSLLSRPRISTMNNQKALIKVGKDEYYSLGLTNTTSFGGSSTTSQAGFSLQSFFSGIALDITPQIQTNHEVLLHIHPIISNIVPTDFTITDDGKSYKLQVPQTQITETDTLVRAKSGQVIVIAGLMREEANTTHYNIPVGKHHGIPYNKSNTTEKKELFILLRPTVVEDKLWSKQLNHIANIYAHAAPKRPCGSKCRRT